MSSNAVFRRRISFQDIQGRIHIGIRPTIRTGKARLAFAALSVHNNTRRTGLACVAGIDFEQITPAVFEFVCQDRLKRDPSLIQNGSVQACFLAHHTARVLNGSLGTGRHSFCVQLFQHHCAKPTRNRLCGLVVPVPPGPCLARRQSRNTALGVGLWRCVWNRVCVGTPLLSIFEYST